MLGTMGRAARRAATGRGLRAGAAALVAIAMLGADLATTGGVANAEPGGVVISELNYHAGSDLDTDDFLELTNTGGDRHRRLRLVVHRRASPASCPPARRSPPAAASWSRRTRRGSTTLLRLRARRGLRRQPQQQRRDGRRSSTRRSRRRRHGHLPRLRAVARRARRHRPVARAARPAVDNTLAESWGASTRQRRHARAR